MELKGRLDMFITFIERNVVMYLKLHEGNIVEYSMHGLVEFSSWKITFHNTKF
ncbi:hypothetical protein HanPSC8_Chr05g0228021 [Helianthus annuus]|nr:hypothetical protein HanPSC8_Chr05g0228021 [Helianthus annuus]